MLLNLRNNLHWVLFIIGITIYPIIINRAPLSLGIVWLIFILYLWLTLAILFKQYDFQHFLYSLCSIGIIISISLFFLYGIEEVPFPQGAILFKLEGIAPSLLLFFIFTVPLILYHHVAPSNLSELIKPKASHPTTMPKENKETINDENWEEATIEDLESGLYEAP